MSRPGTAAQARPPARQPRAANLLLLEQLASWYPQLFGAQFLPLKRGIFQDLLDAHPEALEADPLKAALAQHTRSSRYLVAVAQGLARHDLQGQPIEPMAPEHEYQALLEVFRRRQARAGEDLAQTLRRRIVQAFERSGLGPDAYAARVRGRDAAANALLDAALAQARADAARGEALLRAFEAGAVALEAFADRYGMDPGVVAQTLARARRARAQQAPQG